jgi:hypothetical protein
MGYTPVPATLSALYVRLGWILDPATALAAPARLGASNSPAWFLIEANVS